MHSVVGSCCSKNKRFKAKAKITFKLNKTVTEKGMKTKQQRRNSLTNDQMKVSSKVIFLLEKTNDFQHTWYKFPMKDIVSFSLGQQLNKSRETIFNIYLQPIWKTWKGQNCFRRNKFCLDI